MGLVTIGRKGLKGAWGRVLSETEFELHIPELI